MRYRRWLLVGLAVFLTAAGIAASCRKGDQPNQGSSKTELMRVGYLPIIPDLPIFVANDQGFFEKHGLKPELRKILLRPLNIEPCYPAAY
jgi:ABC-type nitrate/sulfonate/bicarbonate transport system substrate-binding protein